MHATGHGRPSRHGTIAINTMEATGGMMSPEDMKEHERTIPIAREAHEAHELLQEEGGE